MVLVEQIYGGAAGARSVWLENLDLDQFWVDLELVELFQTGLRDNVLVPR